MLFMLFNTVYGAAISFRLTIVHSVVITHYQPTSKIKTNLFFFSVETGKTLRNAVSYSLYQCGLFLNSLKPHHILI